MKITGTNSYIKVEMQDKIVKIQGEMIVNGFVAYSNTIKSWEPPNQDEEIDQIEKEEIIKAVTNHTKDSHFKIVFE